MKKLFAFVSVIVMMTGCTNISPEQKEKIVDLVIAGINVAEQVYVADAQTKEKDYELKDVDGNGSIEYQLALAYKLSKLDGSKAFEGGESYATEIRHFIVRMVELQADGAATTPLRIKVAKVKDKKIEELMFCLLQDDGTLIDETCVNCCVF